MDREKKLRVLTLVIFLLAVSCSTISFEKLETPESDLCLGTAPKKKFTFLLVTESKVPPGMPVTTVKQYLDHLSESYKYISEQFIRIILAARYRRLEDGGYVRTYNNQLNPVPRSEFGRLRLPTGMGKADVQLGWLKDFTFFAWDNRYWGELDPSSRSGDGRCEAFYGFFSEGDGSGCADTGSQHGLRGYFNAVSEPSHGLLRFQRINGFTAASFIESHYFLIPERDQPSLCTKAGLPQSCLNMSHPGVKDVDQGTKLAQEAKKTLDLLFAVSTQTSKAIDGTKTSYRIDWDPTLFCKYAHSNSDMFTR